jgi:hypothetical protein
MNTPEYLYSVYRDGIPPSYIEGCVLQIDGCPIERGYREFDDFFKVKCLFMIMLLSKFCLELGLKPDDDIQMKISSWM